MNIDFIGKRKIYYIISSMLIIVGIVSMVTRGFEMDIELVGGTIIEAELGQTYENADIADLVKEVTGTAPRVQKMGNNVEAQTGVSISTAELTEEQKEQILTKIAEKYSIEDINAHSTFRTVSAAFGSEMSSRAIKAVIVAVILIMLYIAIMFKALSGLSAGVAASMALAHDLFIMISLYSILQMPINTIFVAALLTILGYSVNDTVVIYDRIRENTMVNRRMGREELVNLSVNQSLKRTMYTSIGIFVALCILLGFSIYYRVDTIKEFALPLMVGILSGTYSSTLLSGSLWVDFNNIASKKKTKKA
ncbi:MAG: protein translocase subunit SecF [Clostridiales bacterium]|nr:protein translocase subunit SecF [Clostridiales bacterium]